MVSKTIQDIPCACEIFEVSQSLGAPFGEGYGRMILRGAVQIGEMRSRVPDQRGSRKGIALANTIEHLLDNHKTFHAAMQNCHGRLRNNPSIRTGRRISALSFIVFSVAVGDHLQKRIVPLASKAQKAGVSSWEMDQECHRVLAEIRHDRCVLRELRH